MYVCMYQLELVLQSFSSILSKRINLGSGLNELSDNFPYQRGKKESCV